MQEKKKTGRGGYREGAGRKPFGEKAFETTIVARINQEEKTWRRSMASGHLTRSLSRSN